MKSWADHCSSDEESVDDLPEDLPVQRFEPPAVPPAVDVVDPKTMADAAATTNEEEELAPQEDATGDLDAADADGEAPPAAPKVRTYDFPDQPPFTAFVGNLAYSMEDPEVLKAEIIQCAKERLNLEIHVLDARISFGRDGKHRGFGYVELETLDELKTLMNLNDGESTIAGRKVQLDTANGPGGNNRKGSNRQSFGQGRSSGAAGEIDGSKFRGGRFNSGQNNHHNNRRNPQQNKDDGPPMQRASLKLAPRTRKEGENDKQGVSSNIFGGARARDEQAWEKRKVSSKSESHNTTNNNSSGTVSGTHSNNNKNFASNGNKQHDNQSDRRRPSHSTGRGRGGGRGAGEGRGRGAKGGHSSSNNHETGVPSRRSNEKGRRSTTANALPQTSPEERAAVAAAKEATATATTTTAAPAAAVAAKPAPPTNKFELLMDSDSE